MQKAKIRDNIGNISYTKMLVVVLLQHCEQAFHFIRRFRGIYDVQECKIHNIVRSLYRRSCPEELVFPVIMLPMNWFVECADTIAKHYKNCVEWKTPLDFPVVQLYVKKGKEMNDQKPPNFAVKAALGMFAGMCGAFVGTPAEIALVRMTADGRLPDVEKRNYKNVFDALTRITKQEGILMLWRGAIPTMGRSMVVNGAQLASYSQAKEFLLNTS
ncbi:hypothetical protein PGB90_007867 [Kerria lacca]